MKGVDSNRQQIREIARDTLTHLHGKQPTPKELDRSIEKLRGARLFDLTECGRAVHAEMEALSACARVGVSPRGGTLFTTTFPCHNCAKHLIAAGISRVVYVEPYPKSRALQLHDDALALEERDGPSHEKPDDVHSTKVRLVPFIGIGARRYFDLFSMRLGFGEPKKRAIDGRVIPWNPSSLRPRAGMSAASYLQRERMAAAELQHVVPRQPRRRSYARSKK